MLTGGAAGTTSAYEGSDISTGSQTPESVTNPSTDVSGGIAGTNGGEGNDNAGA
jgi:hypothetical protein